MSISADSQRLIIVSASADNIQPACFMISFMTFVSICAAFSIFFLHSQIFHIL